MRGLYPDGKHKSRRRVQSGNRYSKIVSDGESLNTLLPLFPLDLVLLPGVPLTLHIFEPRYKEMIKECLDHKSVFGIIRSKEESLANIGCTAEIMNVLKKYSDGRMNILVEGKKRFEVLQVNQERTFLQAEVFYLQDDENEPAAADDVEKATRLHQQIMELAGAQPEKIEATETAQLAYHLAGSLPFDPDFQQALLEMSSEAERTRALVSFFERILPVLQRSASTKQKAGGNGHV
jgi:Lon protease-like protein